MALELRRPGTQATHELPGFPGAEVVYTVPDEQMAREVKAQYQLVAKQANREIDAAKVVFGLLFVEVRGVKWEDSDRYTLEKDKAGRLTQESLEIIFPLFMSLWRVAMELVGSNIDVIEAKNS